MRPCPYGLVAQVLPASFWARVAERLRAVYRGTTDSDLKKDGSVMTACRQAAFCADGFESPPGGMDVWREDPDTKVQYLVVADAPRRAASMALAARLGITARNCRAMTEGAVNAVLAANVDRAIGKALRFLEWNATEPMPPRAVFVGARIRDIHASGARELRAIIARELAADGICDPEIGGAS